MNKKYLLNKKEFISVFNLNNKKNINEIIIYIKKNNLNYPRIGLIISKKNIIKSYKRNKIKRLIKEYFLLEKEKIIFLDFVFIITKKISYLDNKNLKLNIKKTWNNFLNKD